MKTKHSSGTFILVLVLIFSAVITVQAREDHLHFDGVKELIIEGIFFDVTIKGHSDSSVEAYVTFPDSLFTQGVKVLHKQSASELHIWVEKPIMSISLFGQAAKMDLAVPYSTDLQLSNSSGDVIVEKIEYNEMRIKTSSGEIELDEITADLWLSSSSGDIVIKNSNGHKNIETASGDLSVSHSDGNITTQTSSGDQQYDSIGGNIIAASSSGSIKITDQRGTLNLESSSGEQTGRKIRLTEDSSFKTSSGEIDFDFINEIEEFSFDLQSSSGTIELGLTKAKGRIVSGNGPIKIYGKSSSGDQTYR